MPTPVPTPVLTPVPTPEPTKGSAVTEKSGLAISSTMLPSRSPVAKPTKSPTLMPTKGSAVTEKPVPEILSTMLPSSAPVAKPTKSPTPNPTVTPTDLKYSAIIENPDNGRKFPYGTVIVFGLVGTVVLLAGGSTAFAIMKNKPRNKIRY